ncbi:UNVERIFIED_CONTAM: hypothetical protein FKN15_044959 [Acipenser sinensis]
MKGSNIWKYFEEPDEKVVPAEGTVACGLYNSNGNHDLRVTITGVFQRLLKVTVLSCPRARYHKVAFFFYQVLALVLNRKVLTFLVDRSPYHEMSAG